MLLLFFFLFHYHLLAIHYVETLGQCAIHCASVDGVYAICGRLLHYRRNNLHDACGIVIVAEDAYGHTDGGCLTVLGGDFEIHAIGGEIGVGTLVAERAVSFESVVGLIEVGAGGKGAAACHVYIGALRHKSRRAVPIDHGE